MYRYTALSRDNRWIGGANDVGMRPHAAIVHYALLQRKCLSHCDIAYPGEMTPNERLKIAREAAGYENQAAAAAALGISVNTYRQHENDTRNLGGIPRDKAPIYARKFKVSLDWLLTGAGDMRAPDPLPPVTTLTEMLQLAIFGLEPGVPLGEFPRLVAPVLHEQLEQYRADAEASGSGDEPTAPGKGARSPAATKVASRA